MTDKKLIVLSYTLAEDTPLYGSTPPIKTDEVLSIQKGDVASTCLLHIHNHLGTHMDCPAHFVDGGKFVNDYPLAYFTFGNPTLIEVDLGERFLITADDIRPHAGELGQTDLLLIKTGYCRIREEGRYCTHNPGISAEAFAFIRKNLKQVRAIGVDSVSVSSYQHREEGRRAHVEALRSNDEYGEPLLLLEDVNLDFDGTLRQVTVLPLVSMAIDSTPVTIVGLLK